MLFHLCKHVHASVDDGTLHCFRPLRGSKKNGAGYMAPGAHAPGNMFSPHAGLAQAGCGSNAGIHIGWCVSDFDCDQRELINHRVPCPTAAVGMLCHLCKHVHASVDDGTLHCPMRGWHKPDVGRMPAFTFVGAYRTSTVINAS